jgi:hypothetical protein
MLKNRSGTAEIVGTVLFLVILFFFFSNVFLWHNQISQEMDSLIADKMNSAVRIETKVLGGEPVNSNQEDRTVGMPSPYWQYDPQSTKNRDGYYRTIQEELALPSSYSLDVNYAFATTIDTTEKMRLITAVRLSVYANYHDELNEPCFVYVRDFVDNAWIDTGLMMIAESRWSNTTLSLPRSYIDGRGIVKIRIVDASSQLGINDTKLGTLNIDCMEVHVDSIALEVTNLGGVDASLSRLWIVDSTDHVFADLESLNIWVRAGSHRNIVFTPSIDTQDIVINYVPPSNQIVTFRILTKLGNTAACDCYFD